MLTRKAFRVQNVKEGGTRKPNILRSIMWRANKIFEKAMFAYIFRLANRHIQSKIYNHAFSLSRYREASLVCGRQLPPGRSLFESHLLLRHLPAKQEFIFLFLIFKLLVRQDTFFNGNVWKALCGFIWKLTKKAGNARSKLLAYLSFVSKHCKTARSILRNSL